MPDPTPILFAGGELEAFDTIGGFGINDFVFAGAGGSFDANFATGAIALGGFGWAEAVFRDATTGAVSPQTNFWVHMEVVPGTLGGSTIAPYFVLVDSSTGTVAFQFDCDGSAATHNLEYWTGAAFTAITPNDTLVAATLYRLDFWIKIDNVNGELRYYRDGVLRQTFSGDTLYSGFSVIDTLVLFCPNNETGTNATTSTKYSQVIVSTQDTRGMRLATLNATALGTTSAWTGVNADISDTVVVNENTFLSSIANGNVSTHTATDLTTVAGGYQPIAVVVAARARKDSTGPQNLHLGVRTNAADNFPDAVTGLEAGLRGFRRVMHANPVTGLSWTKTEINAIEVGVKAVT